MKILAVIPMRAGSKGLPGKNSMKLGGEYLATRVVRTITSSMAFDKIVCSTDSEALASIALASGAEVPFMRPSELAGDLVPTSEVISHAVGTLDSELGLKFSHVFVFQVTSPFVTVGMIHEAVDVFKSNEHVDSVICGTQVPDKMKAELQFGLNPAGEVASAVSSLAPVRRQNLPPRFIRCGNLYGTRVGFLNETGDLVGGNVRAVVVDKQFCLDIDSISDLQEAERRLGEQVELS